MSSTSQHVGIESLRMLTLVVYDVDEALEFYTETLGFNLKPSWMTPSGSDNRKRWPRCLCSAAPSGY